LISAPAEPDAGWAARVNRALDQAEAIFIGAALAFASLLLFVNVVLRYVFHWPISWAEEVSLYLMVWIVFIGGSMAVRTRGHMAIDLLPLVLSPKSRQRLSVFVALLALVFFAVFFWYSGQHVLRVQGIGQTTPVMGAPMWLAYLAMPVGSALMGLRTIQVLVRSLRERPATEAHVMDLQD
jgi:C4-dicarboxylate transporter DctQ subunit